MKNKGLLSLLFCLIWVGCLAAFPAKVLWVIDGDTLKIQRGIEAPETLRLIGIDAPESSVNPKTLAQAKARQCSVNDVLLLGQKSKFYLKEILPKNTEIEVELDLQTKDAYGRTLGYLFLKDGTFLNEKVLQDGVAEQLTIRPNTKYYTRLKSAALSVNRPKLK